MQQRPERNNQAIAAAAEAMDYSGREEQQHLEWTTRPDKVSQRPTKSQQHAISANMKDKSNHNHNSHNPGSQHLWLIVALLAMGLLAYVEKNAVVAPFLFLTQQSSLVAAPIQDQENNNNNHKTPENHSRPRRKYPIPNNNNKKKSIPQQPNNNNAKKEDHTMQQMESTTTIPLEDYESYRRHSPLSAQVHAIHHLSHQAKIVVTLRHDENIETNGSSNTTIESSNTNTSTACRRPKLVGRLSGPLITRIEWHEPAQQETPNENASASSRRARSSSSQGDSTSATTTTTVVTGHYCVPEEGRYFIEIIGILCNDLDFDQPFLLTCVENPLHHRLTRSNATIDVEATIMRTTDRDDGSQTPCASAKLGYWKQTKNQTDSQDTSQQPQEPLLTRFQPQNCRTANQQQQPYCDEPMNRSRFDPYEFELTQTNDDADTTTTTTAATKMTMTQLLETKMAEVHQRNLAQGDPTSTTTWTTNTKSITLCFVGLSHSRVHKELAADVWRQRNLSQRFSSISLALVNARFPTEVTGGKWRQLQRDCTYSLIAVGQWSLGKRMPINRGQPPTYFPLYQEQVTAMIETLQAHNVSFALRSIHYNPLGDLITKCPNPADWRHPATVDGYNAILKRLAQQYNVTYLTTAHTDIISPMWDAAGDWSHYRDELGMVEVQYLIYQLLSQLSI